jgi:hypothetical protein
VTAVKVAHSDQQTMTFSANRLTVFLERKTKMPVMKKPDGWYWGSKGPFPTKQKAIQVGQAAHASGFKGEAMTEDEYTVQAFVLCLLHSVTNAHILHLQSRSYSEHKALGNYYNDVADLIDSYVEAYQGKYGLIEGYGQAYAEPAPALEYMIGLSQYVRVSREQLPQDSELQNITDEIAQLIDSTIYKLRFLK